MIYVLILPASVLVVAIGFLVYAVFKYAPVVGRIFEEKPVFFPLRAEARPEEGEDVRFRTADGLQLAGTYFPHRASQRLGVLVFCHEYLGNRWSALPYVDYLRDAGFDLFSFDFRNHGDSESEPGYEPLQWVCGRELRDLKGALAYLRARPDRDPAGVALMGISRGGGTALCVAADDPEVWGVTTDGAFPTRGTMMAYIMRWAEIYIGDQPIWQIMPQWVFALVGWAGRMRCQWRLKRVFPNVERAVARLAPRPWLMIHGGKDAYIGQDIARAFFDHASEPKDCWFVPGAKHNRCREIQPEEYAERVSTFLRLHAPRCPGLASQPQPQPERLPVSEPRLLDRDYQAEPERAKRPSKDPSPIGAAPLSTVVSRVGASVSS
jgi:pimeloyl-ACP methyl ester carboxylesterase